MGFISAFKGLSEMFILLMPLQIIVKLFALEANISKFVLSLLHCLWMFSKLLKTRFVLA